MELPVDVVVHTAGVTSEVTIERHAADVTLGDLVARCGGRAPVVFVDGRPLPASTTLDAAGLAAGSTVTTTPAPRADAGAETGPGGRELVTIAGPGSGTRVALAAGRYRLGAGQRDRVTDAVVELAVVDGATPVVSAVSDVTVSLDGRRLDGPTPWRDEVLVADGRAYALRGRPPALARLGGHDRGRLAFNRPPRRPAPAPPPSLEVPVASPAPTGARRFPVLALLAPLPVAAGMAVVLGSSRFLLFGLLSPVMLLANWVEDARSRRGDRRVATRADRAAAAAFAGDVAARRAVDLAAARAAHPTMPDVLDTVEGARPVLWERRAGHADAMVVPVGVADMPWTPEVRRPARHLPAADELLAAGGPLPAVPVAVDLAAERGLALVGDPARVRAVARATVLVAATLHGPADLAVVVCASPDDGEAWEWIKWLPHVQRGGVGVVLTTAAQAADRLGALGPGTRTTLLVADGATWWHGRRAPLQGIAGTTGQRFPVRLVACTDDPARVPAACTTVVTVPPDGAATVDHLVARQRDSEVALTELDVVTATDAARAMAALEDPERRDGVAISVPGVVSILDVLGIGAATPAAVRARWSDAGRGGGASTPIGIGADGVVAVDLVADGPHALVAGTTGSGKSELLRTLVAGWAASVPPDELNLVLVDFKGGAAFDACAGLPHTVALVTDLDEHLAGRVLRCLRAELTDRERWLRGAGASSLEEHLRRGGRPPIPRLVVVIDEFALLAAELPDFVPALVDVAQRGRSLGFHLVLATQRPAGVVDQKIKANTNLRIALRVQDDADSLDVVGSRDAALLPRDRPGRAVARFGAGELVALQTALSTGTSRRDDGGLLVRPFLAARAPNAVERALARDGDHQRATGADRPSDLASLVGAIVTAATDAGQLEQRRPYLEPLPRVVGLDELCGAAEPGDGAPFALVDRPDERRRDVRRWTPGAGGSLLVYGITGSGTSSTLATLALSTAATYAPDDAHLYVIDADAGLLGPLAALPHCGAVATIDDLPRLARVVHHLVTELERRRRLAGRAGGPADVLTTEPAITLLVDNVGALRQVIDADRELELVWRGLELIVRDGRGLGIGTVLAASHERAVPAAMAAQIPDRLVMRLGDRMAYSSFGIRGADVPAMTPGRALVPEGAVELQVASPSADLAAAVARLAGPSPRRPPVRVDPLPDHVELDLAAATRTTSGVSVPVGLDLRTATTRRVVLELGTSWLVLGPARSGRSSVLLALAQAVAAADATITRFSVAPRATPLADTELTIRPSGPGGVAAWVDAVLSCPGPAVVLVDDADRLDGPSFARLAATRRDDVAFAVAATSDGVRPLTHWTRPLLRSRNGLLLAPVPIDGDLLRVQLPARLPPAEAGRGLLVEDGQVVPVLVARPAPLTAHTTR